MQRTVLVVYANALVLPIAQALATLAVERAWVVNYADLHELCSDDDVVVANVCDGVVIGGHRTLDMLVDVRPDGRRFRT